MRKLCEEEGGMLKSVLRFVDLFWCMAKVEDECVACFNWPWHGFVF